MNSPPQSITRRFEWTINGATSEKLTAPNFKVESGVFRIVLGEIETEWTVVLDKTREQNASPDTEPSVSIWLYKKKATSNDYKVSGVFQLTRHSKKHISRTGTQFKDGIGFGHFDAVTVETLFIYNRDDCLVIPFEMTLTNLAKPLEIPPLPKNVTTEHKSHLFDNGLFTDFTLVSADKIEFKVHRSYLSEGSSFFMALFTTDMKEKIEGKAAFEDIDSAELKKVLDFIYKGTVMISSVKEASDILYAAEKFDIAGLKALCIKQLSKDVKKENVVEVLAAVDKFNIRELEPKCFDIVARDFIAIMGSSDEWKELSLAITMKLFKAFEDFKESTSITILTSNV